MIDASAILAILFSKPEAAALAERIGRQEQRYTTVPALLETAIRFMQAKSADPEVTVNLINDFLAEAEIGIVDIGAPMLPLAIDAFARYGKGRHPARLNFGDCLAYAAAKQHRSRLVFKGEDFTLTDVNEVTGTRPR